MVCDPLSRDKGVRLRHTGCMSQEMTQSKRFRPLPREFLPLIRISLQDGLFDKLRAMFLQDGGVVECEETFIDGLHTRDLNRGVQSSDYT